MKPVPCLGSSYDTDAGRESDCGHEHAGGFNCEDCILTGGVMDPRTGKKANAKRIAFQCSLLEQPRKVTP